MPISYRNRRLPDFRRGQALKAEDLQEIVDVLRGLQRAGAGGRVARGSAGGVVSIDRPAWLARITASGASGGVTKYSWRGVYETVAGTYADRDASFAGVYNGADGAYERNGATAVATNSIVEMDRDPSTGEPRFFAPAVAATGSNVYPVKAPAGGIAAMSGSTPGSATCTKYVYSGGSLTATGTTLTVLNGYTSAVGANKFLWVVDWSGATWVANEAC